MRRLSRRQGSGFPTLKFDNHTLNFRNANNGEKRPSKEIEGLSHLVFVFQVSVSENNAFLILSSGE